MTMKRLHATVLFGVLVATLALLAGGCGGNDAQSAGPVPSETGTETGTTGGPAPDTRQYRIWFANGWVADESKAGREYLYPVWREGPRTVGVGAAALRLLLEGPTVAEMQPGINATSAIPPGARLLGLDIEDGTATVDLTSEFESGGGSASMFVRLAQVVYTLTEFDTVQRVRFALDGKPVDVFSGEGIVLDEPVTRADYDELLPPIVVDTPLLGRRVSSPIRLTGTANVFEANVTGRVLDANGDELVSRFTTATCGTGCRGRFSIELPYQSPVDQRGTVVLSDDDADGNGRPQFEVRIPVTLSQP
jgi:spore germination protein GerM